MSEELKACEDLAEALASLLDGLDKTTWSAWQTTAYFSKQEAAARTALASYRKTATLKA